MAEELAPQGQQPGADATSTAAASPAAVPASVASSAAVAAATSPSDQPTPAKPVTARTLRQRIEDHPAGLFVGIAIAAATATLGIVLPLAQLTQDSRVASVEAELARYKAEQQLVVDGLRSELEEARRSAEVAIAQERAQAQARIDELERSLSGITRTLGDGSDAYDVSRLVVDARDAASIPATSLYDPAERFYALDPAQVSGWTYERSTNLAFTAALLGVTEESYVAGQVANAQRLGNPITTEQAREMLTRFPIHVWYFGDDKVVELRDPVGDVPLSLHPRTMVVLQRLTHDEFIDAQVASLTGPGIGAADVIRAGFARDPTGWVAQDQLVADIAFWGSLRPRIESLQKRDDLAYMRTETVLPDVTVEGQPLPAYYWTKEWLIVDSGQDIYSISTHVSDDDHRAPDYAALTAWLDALRIVRS